jgi:Flp pilus assembly protein TadD
MELQHPMTCFLGQKATLIAKMFHLLAALPSFNKQEHMKSGQIPSISPLNRIGNLNQNEEQVISYFFLVIEDTTVFI